MESTKGGFITVYRKILDWEWYDDIPTYRLFTHLLYTVNWKDGKWHGITIKRGQRIASYQTLADETGLSVKQVRTAIAHLVSTSEIKCDVISVKGLKRARHVTLVTVANYEVYQSGLDQRAEHGQSMGTARALQGQSKGKAWAEHGQSMGIDRTIINNNKQGEKEEQGEQANKGRAGASPSFPKSIDDGLAEYKEALREVGKPVSYAGLRRIGDKLMKLATDSDGVIDEEKAKAILDQSIIHSWRDVYPLDENSKEEEGDEEDLEWLTGEGFEDPFAHGRYDI